MKAYAKEFREFLLKQNAFALAVGVIIGAAVGKVVSGIVDDILMPIVGLVLPGGEWRAAQLHLSGANAIKYGDFVGRIVDFIFIAAVVFWLTRLVLEKGPFGLANKSCPECLETIPLAARRCRACGSALSGQK